LLPGTGASVAGMAMSPYGKTLVTVGAKGVKLWEVEKRKELAGLTEKPTLAIAYSEGGIDMAISRSDSVEIWDAISKKLKHTLKVKGAAALAFMFNGQVLATGDAGGQIQLWNIEDGKLLTKASVNTGPILGLAVSSANDRLAAAGKDKTTLMTIQGQSSSTIIKPLAQLAGGRSVSYSQDGQLLALIGSDNTIHLANGSTGVVRKILKTNAGQATVNTVLFSSDGTYLGAGGSKEAKGLGAGVVTLWEVQKIIPK
jgi:WD40 repeat protein